MLDVPAQRPWRDPRFEPVQFVGRGTSGVVYAALDRDTGGEVALKTFAERDPEALYRLKQEFRACAGVRHRNLVELYELRADDHDCFFTMELVHGVDFVRHVRGDEASPSLVRFLAGAEQLVQGVAALHAAGRLHRDVKPPNALVTAAGRVVLLDFSYTVAFGQRALAVERSDSIAGSLAYMAPEVVWGREGGPAADWYSVGVVFYEALAGRLPFATSSATLIGASHPRPAPLAGVPDELRQLIEALLASGPEERPDAQAIARVIATCSVEQRAAMPPPAALVEELPFVGREAELQALRGAAAELAAGTPSVVLICGASGIGKSELVRRFLADVEGEDDAIVLSGRCHPYELVPYRAFDGVVDALSRHLLGLEDAAMASLVPPHAATLVRLFPVLGRVPALAAAAERESGDAQEQRRRGFTALRALLRRVSAQRRLVLWIDDVQWADADSAALSRELFAGADAPHGLVLLSYRSDDRRRAETFAAFDPDAGGDVRRRLIELGPLSDDEAHVLAARFAAGHPADVSAAVRDAAGSPFLLDQLVRHHLTSPGAAQGLPDVIQARLEQLAAPARTLLEVIAVAGRPLEQRVALLSADLLKAARRELITLQEERLLRLAPTSATAVEVYHDRIRESLLANLPPAALRERHRSLAHTLVREPDPDPQALYRHFLGAGERDPAADWAAEAAARADRVLAFAEAAELYAAAADLLDGESPRHWTMQERRAGALVNAGRGAEAAPLFAAAADRRSGGERLDLRRRAVEQLLQTGRMDEGTASLRQLLSDVGLSYPRSTAAAAVPTLLRLTAIASRPGRLRARRAAVTPEARLRIDSSRCAAKGLVMVDPFRGMYFAVRTLALALRSGDPRTVLRELAEVGAALVPTGPPFAAWAGRMIDRARAEALAGDDPYLRGLTAITLAQKRMVEGRWRDMLALCDEGAKILTEECAGVSWEVALAHVASDRALEELGEMAELADRADAGLRRAESNGDMYGTVSALESLSIAWTAQGRFAEARGAIRLARRRWVPSGFQMQHLYMFRNEAHCDLAEHAAGRVWTQLEQIWPQIVGANLLRHALLKTDAHLLRARAAIAAARDASAARRTKLRQVAAADARVLERQGRCDTVAHATLLRAAAATQDGDVRGARALLESAAAQFDAAEMALMHAVTQMRLGDLIGGESGVALARAARDRLPGLTGANAEIADVYAPGFAEPVA